jgi:hypothetical protein
MAEADKMLIAVEFDASGAIKDATVLDTKFDKLGNTLRKGEKRAEGAAAAQKKLDKSIKGTTKSTTDNNVATIAKLQVMEAATSGLNQLISAQYKRIDADLASGKITAEEAEELRKKVKQHEKLTGILETGIAMARLYTVAQVIGTAVMHKSTVATELNTAAVARNNAALAMNPYVKFAMVAMAVVSALALMEMKFDGVTRAIERTKKAIEKITGAFGDLRDMDDLNLSGFGSGGGGKAKDTFENRSKGTVYGSGRLA